MTHMHYLVVKAELRQGEYTFNIKIYACVVNLLFMLWFCKHSHNTTSVQSLKCKSDCQCLTCTVFPL